MIFAGPCSYLDISQKQEIIDTATQLKKIKVDNDIDIRFRAKIYCGGTSPVKWFAGIEDEGIPTLEEINKYLMPVGTEVQTPDHANKCCNLSYIWVGARNCQNYGLLKAIKRFPGDILIKRNPGMTIDEMIGLSDIMEQVHERKVYMIERGINTFDRTAESRWSVDLKGAIRLGHERPDIFERLIVDLSHSTGKKEHIYDTYAAFQAIGVKHYMIEVMANPELSETDKDQILSTEEFKNLIGGWLTK
jgi:3-deoxy-7-phosphoheptulonate synthase